MQRRTQAERREMTQQALIQATIECLLELGYAETTTRAISRRAGVSQGAQQHYFPSRSTMINAALTDITRQLTEEFCSWLQSNENEEQLNVVEIIDQLWLAHNLPIARTVYDVFHEAREDVEVAQHIANTLKESVAFVHSQIKICLPKAASHPKFIEWLFIAEALMRGTVMISMIPGAKGGYAEWPIIRNHIMQTLDQFGIYPK